MSTFGVAWARDVIDRTPKKSRDIPVAQRAEAFGDLAAAYEVLADQAGADGDIDAQLGYADLFDHYQWLAEQWRGEGVIDET